MELLYQKRNVVSAKCGNEEVSFIRKKDKGAILLDLMMINC